MRKVLVSLFIETYLLLEMQNEIFSDLVCMRLHGPELDYADADDATARTSRVTVKSDEHDAAIVTNGR